MCGPAWLCCPCLTARLTESVALSTVRSLSRADLAHSKKFDGECADGSEIRMYEGNGDNPGTAEERAIRCSAACKSKKKALSGSWDGFVAKGFVVIPTTGRCYCESSHSLTCKRSPGTNPYDRYDWKVAPGL